jgi:hypothetical protein
MNGQYKLIAILFLLTSCGQREHILMDKDFDELRLSEHGATETIWLTTDTKIINQLKDEVYFIDNEACHGTTPDNAIQFLKDGSIVETYGYCYDYQTNLDNLKDKLHKTTEHELDFPSKQDWQLKLKQLNTDRKVKVDYTTPDSIDIYGFGILNINITDPTKEEQEKHTVKLFNAIKNLYELYDNQFSLRAWKFSPDGTIDYTIAIRCDKNWSDAFDTTKLNSNDLTSRFEIYSFKADKYKIIYRDWTE